MADNTGINQAVVAYRVRTTDGAPLDVNGDPTSESNLRQAILLLQGFTNPNPALYEVMGFFAPKAVVTGNPTAAFDPDRCATGFILVDPARLVFDDSITVLYFNVLSSADWALQYTDAALNGVLSLDVMAGVQGKTMVKATIEDGAAYGQGYLYFKNLTTLQYARLYVAYVQDAAVWILAAGDWNNNGFWFNNETWNYD